MACYKSALIDLDCRWANKGQDMHQCGNENKGCVQNKSGKLIVYIFGSHFEANFCPFCGYQPDRLRRVDTGDSEAIVGSANIDEIAELNRND